MVTISLSLSNDKAIQLATMKNSAGETNTSSRKSKSFLVINDEESNELDPLVNYTAGIHTPLGLRETFVVSNFTTYPLLTVNEYTRRKRRARHAALGLPNSFVVSNGR